MSRKRNESGVVLIVCLIVVLVFSAIGLALAQTIAAQFVFSQRIVLLAGAAFSGRHRRRAARTRIGGWGRRHIEPRRQ